MTSGLDLSRFQLRRIPTPEWAVQGVIRLPGIEPAQLKQIDAQSTQIQDLVERTLTWALTDPDAIKRFQHRHSYAEGVEGEYFIGRQSIEPDPSQKGQFFVECECCLTRNDSLGLPAIYHRYTVIVAWTPTTQTGVAVFAREQERESQLARLGYQLVRTFDLASLPRGADLTEQTLSLVLARWSEILECLQSAAMEAVEDGSGSGELDNDFFPSRLAMTGEYYIDLIAGDNPTNVMVMLHFLEHPFMAGQTDVDYLGYDLSLDLTAHPMTYELWGSSAI
ncbi:hypothetical protein [Deinococcus sp. UR1]|uniref:hypothetical protein n=1 Tax=Deinococcus sp. UR1 TaxID=1704277 RepID=UPI000AA4AB3F|nr:hypothetical protein [Deinococcus sp. UR1]